MHAYLIDWLIDWLNDWLIDWSLCGITQYKCGGQRAICRSGFSLSTTWVLGIKVRFGGKWFYMLCYLTLPFLFIQINGAQLKIYSLCFLIASVCCYVYTLACIWKGISNEYQAYVYYALWLLIFGRHSVFYFYSIQIPWWFSFYSYVCDPSHPSALREDLSLFPSIQIRRLTSL